MVEAPIFHSNGDDPEACLRTKVAIEYRRSSARTWFVDMFCTAASVTEATTRR